MGERVTETIGAGDVGRMEDAIPDLAPRQGGPVVMLDDAVVITRVDGGVSVMHIVAGQHPEGTDPVDAELEKFRAAHPGEYVSHRLMPRANLPTHRNFRDAWCDRTPELVLDYDMDKCRAIHRETLRQMRAPFLADLDVQYMRADEAGDAKDKERIALQKQALRDVTADPAIDAAKTPEELMRVIPEPVRPVAVLGDS